MRTFEEIKHLSEFDRDLKQLKKRFRTIEDDLERLLQYSVYAYHKLGQDNEGIKRISGLNIDCPKIYKVRKFTCLYLKGTGSYSGLRLIYAYYEDKDTIELVEIYFKGDKTNEDRDRIYKYYKKGNDI